MNIFIKFGFLFSPQFIEGLYCSFLERRCIDVLLNTGFKTTQKIIFLND